MDRKEIVRLLGENFKVKPQYMGVPSFAYEIETSAGLIIVDREGKITNAEGKEVELEELLNDTKEAERQTRAFDIEVPMEGHTGITLKNLVNMIYSKQELIQKALGLTENIIDDDFSIGINKGEIETLGDFKTALHDIGEKSCPGITFDFYSSVIRFKFLEGEVEPERFKAYSKFIELINENSKTLKYASARVKGTDNEKYTFRTWLLRLGMIGTEYKATRKILLEKLSGNGAFRYGKPEKKNKEVYGEQ
ncbi:virulence-related protein [Clostridium sp. WILCCON 0269]|uniref:Virulence-related protein n=1 Tax=Candidatus Clostridium eludens TaxID=3381663 RepID=A0ABW8SFM5_9CLOT